MGRPHSTDIPDLSEIRFQADTIGAAVRLAFVVFAAGLAYALATWQEPHRALIVALFAGLFVATLLLTRVPDERTARGGRRASAFLLAWSAFSILVAGALTALDGGADSPLALLFFLPIVFAALSYPLPVVVAVSAGSELVLVVSAGVFGSRDPVSLGFLAACLAFIAVLCALQAQNHDRRRAELALTSRIDPLTGCLNRRGFDERMTAELDQAVRTGRALTIVMLDLDRFKEINDTQGHAAGDEILRWAGATIREGLRPMDDIGRLGGDEFGLLLPGAGYAEGGATAERMRAALSRRITATTGAASFPAHGIDSDDLLKHADAELYAAKRGRVERRLPGRRELTWAAALARAVDLRTAGSEGHSSHVARYAAAIGEELDWPEPQLRLLRLAAMLHDVGKVSVPDRILLKRGSLTDDEYAEIKSHPVTGAQLLARVDGLEPILPWIRHSHEHWNGSGYPDGLSGEAIPEASRILLVADAFDALTSTRPYRDGALVDTALAELRRCAGAQFDPDCIAAIEAHVAKAGVDLFPALELEGPAMAAPPKAASTERR